MTKIKTYSTDILAIIVVEKSDTEQIAKNKLIEVLREINDKYLGKFMLGYYREVNKEE